MTATEARHSRTYAHGPQDSPVPSGPGNDEFQPLLGRDQPLESPYGTQSKNASPDRTTCKLKCGELWRRLERERQQLKQGANVPQRNDITSETAMSPGPTLLEGSTPNSASPPRSPASADGTGSEEHLLRDGATRGDDTDIEAVCGLANDEVPEGVRPRSRADRMRSCVRDILPSRVKSLDRLDILLLICIAVFIAISGGLFVVTQLEYAKEKGCYWRCPVED